MTRWKITGADANTGGDILMEIAADTAKQAEDRARLNNVLVASVEPAANRSSATVLEYSGPRKDDPDKIDPSQIHPEFKRAFEKKLPTLEKSEKRFLDLGERQAMGALRLFAVLFYVIGFANLCNAWGQNSAGTSNAIQQLIIQQAHDIGILIGLATFLLAAIFQFMANQIQLRGTIRSQNKIADGERQFQSFLQDGKEHP
jgi:hypothetical protein